MSALQRLQDLLADPEAQEVAIRELERLGVFPGARKDLILISWWSSGKYHASEDQFRVCALHVPEGDPSVDEVAALMESQYDVDGFTSTAWYEGDQSYWLSRVLLEEIKGRPAAWEPHLDLILEYQTFSLVTGSFWWPGGFAGRVGEVLHFAQRMGRTWEPPVFVHTLAGARNDTYEPPPVPYKIRRTFYEQSDLKPVPDWFPLEWVD